MSTTIKIILFIISGLIALGGIIWVLKEPGYESGITCLVGISGLISLLFVKDRPSSPSKTTTMTQNAGDNSNQYQSKGNMTIKK